MKSTFNLKKTSNGLIIQNINLRLLDIFIKKNQFNFFNITKKSKFIFNLIKLICILFNFECYSQSKEKCDMLIKQGIDSMNVQKYKSAIKIHNHALQIATKNNWYDLKFKATNNLGVDFFGMNDYDKALYYYFKAYSLALKENSIKNQMVVLNNISIIYIADEKKEKAKQYLEKALHLAIQSNDKERIGFYKTNLGILWIKSNNLIKGKKLLLEAKENLKENSQVLMTVDAALLNVTLSEKKYNQGINDAKKLLAIAYKNNYTREVLGIKSSLALAYLNIGNYHEAINQSTEGVNMNPVFDSKIKFFEIISNAEFKLGNFEKAIQYKDSIIDTNKKILNFKAEKNFETNKLKIDFLTSDNELKILKQKSNFQRIIWIISILSILIVIILMSIIFKKKILHFKNIVLKKTKIIEDYEVELKETNADKLVLEKQIIDNQNNFYIEQNKLLDEIEERNKKITEKILRQTRKNELINKIIYELENIDKETKNLLNPIKENLKNLLKDDIKWDEYITLFENINPNFIKTLNKVHPNLTPDDVRFISYMYLNFDTKNIASIINITPEGVRKRKERITKKMKLNTDTSLYNYIITLK